MVDKYYKHGGNIMELGNIGNAFTEGIGKVQSYVTDKLSSLAEVQNPSDAAGAATSQAGNLAEGVTGKPVVYNEITGSQLKSELGSHFTDYITYLDGYFKTDIEKDPSSRIKKTVDETYDLDKYNVATDRTVFSVQCKEEEVKDNNPDSNGNIDKSFINPTPADPMNYSVGNSIIKMSSDTNGIQNFLYGNAGGTIAGGGPNSMYEKIYSYKVDEDGLKHYTEIQDNFVNYNVERYKREVIVDEANNKVHVSQYNTVK
jgi:hypothetical protein